jgi:hypothetical protein
MDAVPGRLCLSTIDYHMLSSGGAVPITVKTLAGDTVQINTLLSATERDIRMLLQERNVIVK